MVRFLGKSTGKKIIAKKSKAKADNFGFSIPDNVDSILINKISSPKDTLVLLMMFLMNKYLQLCVMK